MALKAYERRVTNLEPMGGGGNQANMLMAGANFAQQMGQKTKQIADSFARLGAYEIEKQTIDKAYKDIEDGNVDSKNVALVAQQVYMSTAVSKLKADISIDADVTAKMAISQMDASQNYDTDGFAKFWTAYSDGHAKGIKDPNIQREVSEVLNRTGTQAFAHIYQNKIKIETEKTRQSLATSLQNDKDSFAEAFYIGNTDETTRIMQNVRSSLETMAVNGFVTEDEAFAIEADIGNNAIMYSQKREIDKLLADGNQKEVYEALYGKDSNKINHRDKEELREYFNKAIKNQEDAYYQSIKESDREREMKKQEAGEAAINEFLNPTSEYNKAMDNALKTGAITQTEHNNYMRLKDSKAVSDIDVKNYVLLNLGYLEDNEILLSSKLSPEDKNDLFTRNRSARGSWVNNTEYRQAREEVDLHFGVISKDIVSSLDFTGSGMKAYAEMRQYLYLAADSIYQSNMTYAEKKQAVSDVAKSLIADDRRSKGLTVVDQTTEATKNVSVSIEKLDLMAKGAGY